jgi:hypothetical protein
MPIYNINELIEKMKPQARRDKALIARCVDGLGLYAAQIAAENRTSDKINEMRKLAENLVGYWGFGDDNINKNAKSPKDFMWDFDARVDEAKTGGAITGDIYQTAPNVIYGLYRYGEDMVVSQGNTAMDDILDMSGLIKEIGAAWDFEADVLNDLTVRLEAEVRTMLKNTPLPGQAVNGKNIGYIVSQAVLFENDRGFALAHSSTAPNPFVTWQFTNDNGKLDYYWGHYYNTEERAQINYINRVTDYIEQYNFKEKPVPINNIEVDAEQNYNMIDGIMNNKPFPKPDLTDGQTHDEIRELTPETIRDEKPSVLEQIKAAQQVPKQPHKEKSPEKKTGDIDI